jgi:hypothetical protein
LPVMYLQYILNGLGEFSFVSKAQLCCNQRELTTISSTNWVLYTQICLSMSA